MDFIRKGQRKKLRFTIGNLVLNVILEFPVTRFWKFSDTRFGKWFIRCPWEVHGFVYALARRYTSPTSLGWWAALAAALSGSSA